MRWRQQWPRPAARRMDSPLLTPVPPCRPTPPASPGLSVPTQRLGQGQAVGGGSRELGVGVGGRCPVGLLVQGLTAPDAVSGAGQG